ncbi:MAG TPA: DEAD/DEAH box helicase [Candidatus Omnitrophota bacterium]|nr:DEAD/DEAH box helicase [Candidatus Omnitrophota bacterium]
MLLKDLFLKYPFHIDFQAVCTSGGIHELFPPQAQAIKHGALEGKNLLMAVPTAAGKTFVAELCMLQSFFQEKGKSLYIAPLKALASEKFHDFKKRYSPLGLQVGLLTGDEGASKLPLNRYDILIATAEKIDAVMRTQTRWSPASLKVIVFDEIHFLNDASRGPTLEILITRLRMMSPKAQVLALSATVQNASQMASWLRADLVESSWRPIPLKEGVYYDEKLKFKDHGTRVITEHCSEELNDLVMDNLRGKGQTLVFVNSRRSTQASARKLAKDVAKALTPDERQALQDIAKAAVGSSASATKICRALGDVITHGVAFHHAGLKPEQRKLIEDQFKNNLIKVICSTPTLAAGVNLPARRVIMRDIKRFESGLGSSYIPASEYKQCAGRAGRPQYDTHGEAVIMAKSRSKERELFERYIEADPEPVQSKLGTDSSLRIHLLAAVATGLVHDIQSAIEFLNGSFFAFQNQNTNLLELISRVFEFLEKNDLIERSNLRYHATLFGQKCSQLYIDPMSALVLRDGLQVISQKKSIPPIGVLQLIQCCPDSVLLSCNASTAEEIDPFMAKHERQFFLETDQWPALSDYFLFLSIMKTVMVLTEWIEEQREETICDRLNVGPGDIYRVTDASRWLLHAAIVFADLFGWKNLTRPLADLQTRVAYGIREELIPLTRLKNIGRVRARILCERGFSSPSDLKNISIDEIAELPGFGKSIAKNVLDQLRSPVVDLEAVKNFSERWKTHQEASDD